MEVLGTVNAAGSDVKENRPDSRPVYSFGKTATEIEAKGEEDWIKKEKKSKSEVSSSEPLENVKTIRVEEILYLRGLYSESVKSKLTL